MAIMFCNMAFGSSTSTTTQAWPVGTLAGDVAFLIVETANQTPSLSDAQGFTYIGGIGTGTAGVDPSTRIDVWWCRAASSSPTGPTVSDGGGDHITTHMVTFRGCVATGTPYDTSVGGAPQFSVKGTASNTQTFPTLTTSVPDSWPVWFTTNDVNGALAWTGVASSVFGNNGLSELSYATNTVAGNGGQTLQIWCRGDAANTAWPLAAGQSTGTQQASMGSNRVNAMTSLILLAEPYPNMRSSSSASTNTTASNTVTCSYPATSVNGDLLVMCAAFKRSSVSGTQTITTPSGWTLLNTENQSSVTGIVSATYWRFRGAETSVSVVNSNSSSEFGNVQIHSYDAATVDPTTPIAASAITYNTTSSGVAARTCPSVTTASPLNSISVFATLIKTTTGTVTWGAEALERTDGWSGASGDLLFSSAQAFKGAAGSTGTFSVTPSATSAQGILATVAVQPLLNQTVNGTDTGTTAAESGTVQAQVPVTDTGSGVDTATNVKVGGTSDTGSGADAATGIRISGATDTGTGVDSAFVTALVPSSDTGAGVESAYTSSLVVTSDSGQGADTAVNVKVSGASDSGSGSETAFLSAADKLGSDSGTGTENATVTVAASDTGSGLDNGAGNTSHSVDDVGSGVDTATGIRLGTSDTGTGTDNATLVTALVPSSDTGSSVDQAKIKPGTPGDTGSGADAATLRIPVTDSATGVDSAVVSVIIFASDSGTGTDVASIGVTSEDASTSDESAFVFIEGVGVIGNRVQHIAREIRAIRAIRDPHRYQVKPESRLRIFGRDNRTVKIAPSRKDPVRVYVVEGEDDS